MKPQLLTGARTRAFILVLALAALLLPVSGQAGEAALVSVPVFLNGERTYVRSGSAGLPSVAADACRDATGADICILPASAFTSSIAIGDLTQSALDDAVRPQEQLVVTQMTLREVVQLLDQTLHFGSSLFPHVSGLCVRANRVLQETGAYAGIVASITYNDLVFPSDAQNSGADKVSVSGESMLVTVVTTQSLTDNGAWFTRAAVTSDLSLQDALVEYLRQTPADELAEAASAQRLAIISAVLDTDLLLDELTLPIPVAVHANLTEPVVAPAALFFVLRGQDRSFDVGVWDVEIPYMLSIPGDIVKEALADIDLGVHVTQTVPESRKTANTFDASTVFIDLQDNASLPPGTILRASLADIYSPGTALHVYYYAENGDIVPANEEVHVAGNGTVSLRVDPGATYVLNARPLNETLAFVAPTPDHPFIAGVIFIGCAFGLWVVFFLILQHRKMHHRS